MYKVINVGTGKAKWYKASLFPWQVGVGDKVEIQIDKQNSEQNSESPEKSIAIPGDANIVTSVLIEDENGNKVHLPLLDLDIEHFYIQSTQTGHGHLYLNKQLTHDQYQKLLTALHEAGIIQDGVLMQFKRDGHTSLRLPGLKKGVDDD